MLTKQSRSSDDWETLRLADVLQGIRSLRSLSCPVRTPDALLASVHLSVCPSFPVCLAV